MLCCRWAIEKGEKKRSLHCCVKYVCEKGIWVRRSISLPDICWRRCSGADIQMPACHVPLPECIVPSESWQNCYITASSGYLYTVFLFCHKPFFWQCVLIFNGVTVCSRKRSVDKHSSAQSEAVTSHRYEHYCSDRKSRNATVSSLRKQSAVKHLQTGRKCNHRCEKTNDEKQSWRFEENICQTWARAGKEASLFVCRVLQTDTTDSTDTASASPELWETW